MITVVIEAAIVISIIVVAVFEIFCMWANCCAKMISKARDSQTLLLWDDYLHKVQKDIEEIVLRLGEEGKNEIDLSIE